jgi:hypothetical protein
MILKKQFGAGFGNPTWVPRTQSRAGRRKPPGTLASSAGYFMLLSVVTRGGTRGCHVKIRHIKIPQVKIRHVKIPSL